MFADVAKIHIRSGKGGDGCVSFRREMFVPDGGPDGGDGGKGGDLIFEIDEGANTLNDYRYIRKYHAGDGENGKGKRCSGKNGEDVVLKVPEGTVVRAAESGNIIVDMSGKNRRVVVLAGGRGGKGNMNYVTATMQAPMYAQPGQPARELDVILELKCIADVGLVGFPNVGKSTFLARVTNAKPKIANYHFTTLNPNLGVVNLDGSKGFVIADIPGLIEGASEGVGLGHEFLKHIERTRVILHIVDAAQTEGRDPIDDIRKINLELAKYGSDLSEKPQIIVANKLDTMSDEDQECMLQILRDEFKDENVEIVGISAVSGKGVSELLYKVRAMLDALPEESNVFEPTFTEADIIDKRELPFSVFYDGDDHVYKVEGPRIERMLGYTNLETEKGFQFFQNFMKENGVWDKLEELGIEEKDTVRIYGWDFEYYRY